MWPATFFGATSNPRVANSQPLNPLDPRGPASPTGPAGPAAPFAPAGPAGPAAPLSPLSPFGPPGWTCRRPQGTRRRLRGARACRRAVLRRTRMPLRGTDATAFRRRLPSAYRRARTSSASSWDRQALELVGADRVEHVDDAPKTSARRRGDSTRSRRSASSTHASQSVVLPMPGQPVRTSVP